MSGLTIETKQNNTIHIIYVNGYLDAHTASSFETSIEAAMKQNHYKMVINLKGCDYISSAGLGVFMGFLEEIREKGGDIKISNTSEKVYKVFDLLGFPNIFDILNDEQEACEKFTA